MNEDWKDGLDARFEDRYRQLGTRTPRCSVPGCVEMSPFALSGVHPNLICTEHLADRAGQSWLEEHHNQGQANNRTDTSQSPGNDHAVQSEYQRCWPRETLRNPDGSPLLRAAAAIRGWLDVLRLIIDRTVGWVPPFLERLDAWLRVRLGPRWWDAFDADH